jgi:hypothetical protein
LAALGIHGDIGVSGNGKEINVTYKTHIVYFPVQGDAAGISEPE